MYKVIVADQCLASRFFEGEALTNLLCYLQKPPAMPCRRLSNFQGRRCGCVFGAGAGSIAASSGNLSPCTASGVPIQSGSAR
jgi:hypothetical protein